ncbi:MAG: DUF4097 family beta strand repeat-containing protein [Woeseiaceae bacterium]|nr:DUF4097 family beta strand repeat-containing protein [Woeseiaceae bacterium]
MKSLALVAMAVTVVLPAAACADDVRRVVDASPDGLVSISNTAGAVEVSGWSRDQVEVIAELGSGVEELVVERDGGEVRIRVRAPRNRGRGIASDLTVRVPENSSLNVSGVSADITVDDVQGAQRLHSVSGDIETEAYATDVDAETVSGDITILGDGKPMRTSATSVSGDIELASLAGEIKAGSVSGDIAIVRGTLERTALNTTSGDMVFHAELLDNGRLDVETINGDIEIEFVGIPSARFDIETFNGDIRNCFGPKAVRTSRYAPGYELSFTEGSGSGRVIIRTLNGDLRLCHD